MNLLDNNQFLTPKEIVYELDKYIIGQNDAKKNVAIALRNRWRRLNTPNEIQKDISPNNILMIGSTGVGKTEIARRLASLTQAPFIKVEASKFTEIGYVGRDVESMVRDLVENSIKLVKIEKQTEVKTIAEKNVIEQILNILIPPVNKTSTPHYSPESELSDEELNEKTRDMFRKKIIEGSLDDREIEIDIKKTASVGIGMVAPPGMDDSAMLGIQDMISGMMPKKTKKRKTSIKDAKRILLEDEMDKLIDMEQLKEIAIDRAENTGIIFIDEIDKIAKSHSKSGGAEVSREGVQRDLLPIVEGSTVNTKYGYVNTDHILFIAAGAFHIAKPSDLIPELQGRFPIRVELENLTKEDFIRILKEPKNALTKQYKALLHSENVQINFSDTSIERIAELAFEANTEIENIGARRLHTVLSKLLNDILFEVPDSIPSGSNIEITKEMVDEKLSGLVKNKDLSHYIL